MWLSGDARRRERPSTQQVPLASAGQEPPGSLLSPLPAQVASQTVARRVCKLLQKDQGHEARTTVKKQFWVKGNTGV